MVTKMSHFSTICDITNIIHKRMGIDTKKSLPCNRPVRAASVGAFACWSARSTMHLPSELFLVAPRVSRLRSENFTSENANNPLPKGHPGREAGPQSHGSPRDSQVSEEV